MQKKIPFYDLTLSPATRRAVERTLKGGWITTGPAVSQFEAEVGKLLGIKHTAAVSSATAGLVLALRAVGVKQGDEVITTPFSFVAGAEAILHLGAVPVFADIDPATLNINPVSVGKRITGRTAAILAVDIAGYPCDYRTLGLLAKAHRIPLVSDSAHALGARLDGKSIPHWTDLSVYSFHATKNLTCGEGGMAVSRDKNLVARVRLWSKHGMTASAYERKQADQWSYDVIERGFKANMSDILASVGLGELQSFAKNQVKREQLAIRYLSNLSMVEDWITVPRLQLGYHHAWHLMIVGLNLSRLTVSRNAVIDLMARRGIGCSVHYRPIHTLSFFRKSKLRTARLPEAERMGKSVVSLPLYPGLSPSDVDRISDTLISICRRHAR
ncbi:MAG: DegT/DnrJ/EryC1/StrS family aminotransferase [candidate division Zixibacteria bacterium]|nr:DegT/DnrJ/EryC1/StrS family aminotransferase [candidate division Zixibacteria bacterium]